MTDTEAKALFEVRQNLANAAITGGMKNVRPAVDAALDMLDTLTDRVIAAAQTEARHAAEMRELKERFGAFRQDVSDAVEQWKRVCHIALSPDFDPFILPAPDPLVEIAREMTLLDGVVRTDNQKAAIREGHAGNTASEDFYDRLRAAMQARGYQVTKIGEAGE